ncbi:hypothetical protein TNCV_977161 [Trichonephila clavipes]|nr:hypothetical protein TNCV_977161 [Trichonephila clavipes]
MKKHVQGRCFVSSDEVKVASQEALREVAKYGFQLCLQKLHKRWQKSIVAQGNYLRMLRCCELFRVRFATPCARTFGSYYVNLTSGSFMHRID